jgi:hypothetical protein
MDRDAPYGERLRDTFEGDMMNRAIRQNQPYVRVDEPQAATRRSFLSMMAAFMGPAVSLQKDPEGREPSTTPLEAMRRVAKGIAVREITEGKPGPPMVLRPEPLLRFSTPVWRVVDGALWGWGKPGRPAVLMKVVRRGQKRDQLQWHVNVSVLTPIRVEVEFRDGVRWSSRLPGLEARSVPDAPVPADSAPQRLTQAKDLARRISVIEQVPNPISRVQLRLLPRPIDRYSDPMSGLLDGMFFCFVSEGNPAVHLMLEVWTEAGGPLTWRYLFARQGAGEGVALLDEKRLWSAPALRPPADTDLYMGRPLPDSAAAD